MPDQTKLTESHWHELRDRLDVFSNMFEIAIVDHVTTHDPETLERVTAIAEQIDEFIEWVKENRQ